MTVKETYNGVEYKSLTALAQALGVSVSHVVRLRKAGKLQEWQPTDDPYGRFRQVVSAGGMTWASQKECAEFFGVGATWISLALSRGVFEKWVERRLKKMQACDILTPPTGCATVGGSDSHDNDEARS
jgi:hypothetical protein